MIEENIDGNPRVFVATGVKPVAHEGHFGMAIGKGVDGAVQSNAHDNSGCKRVAGMRWGTFDKVPQKIAHQQIIRDGGVGDSR